MVVRTLHLRVKNSSEQDKLETCNMFAGLSKAKMNFSTSKNVYKNFKEKFDIFVWRLVEGLNSDQHGHSQ